MAEGDPQPALIDLTTVFNNTSVLLYSAESSNTDLITVNIVDDRYLEITYLNQFAGQDRTPAVITVTSSITPLVGETLSDSDQFTVTINLPPAAAASMLDEQLLTALAINQQQQRDDNKRRPRRRTRKRRGIGRPL